jgi:3-dehydroquinate synthase
MVKITVRSPSRHYVVHCGRGAARRLGSLLSEMDGSAEAFILSSPRVWKACEHALAPGLRRGVIQAKVLFDDRESAKQLGTVEKICRALVRAGADRQSVLVAVGGGVVGDVAGFAAATYLRGVRLVHVPTTLVAQVDSSIGGKTGVDLPEGKNLVGAFYQPNLVVVDPGLLRMLPDRQYRSGIYEVIKYGIIGDPALFEFLERRMERVLNRDPSALEWIVPRCIRAKAEVVRQDERESGLRQVLNVGHTFGHALEAATAYRRFLHGEAVGWGLIFATLLSVATDRLQPSEASRMVGLIGRLGPLPGLHGIQFVRLDEIMRVDKKSRAGRILWVLPRKIGQVEFGHQVPHAFLRDAYRELSGIFSEARGIA